MKIGRETLKGRQVWTLDNGTLKLSMTQGGGHLAAAVLHDKPRVNPMWSPVWKTIEPWHFRSQGPDNDARLLASLCGHNLCLGWFGSASQDEVACGLNCHGEAPVARWKPLRKRVTASSVSLTCGCELPAANMIFERTLTSRKGSHVVDFKERITSTARRDLPFTMSQHVTLGPPFLEKGTTVFDMSATQAHTFIGAFGEKQRLRPDTAFTWPDGPGAKGETVDMRVIGKSYRTSSDFSTQQMDTSREDAWFSAVNPKQGVMIAYSWRREDFPWIGNWEENYGRKAKPWAGRSLTRGMEFSNSPFPCPLREAVDRGHFQGMPTYRWLPARGVIDWSYSLILMPVESNVRGVADIRRMAKGFAVDLVV